ncbi:hypothetical protein J1605_005915 [Eschrichtius robustus]|uniref:Ig-like domain-containing protein n=1 Tax=Eschrichtius robustus TaxID=9764 RepID=A0AB34H602_ESCRO|nr:hypothetical protein J1605_005915 [Eschrichtius robustus]
MVNASPALFSDVYTVGLPLFAQLYPVVTLGETATLYCNSGSTYDLFALTKQHGEGVYRKPSLSAHWGSSSKKTPSKKLSLRYHSETWFDAFVLSRNGRVEFAQDLSSKYKAGASEADFPVNAIFLMHPGTYRCYYGLHKNFPYLWSEASHVLMLPERDEGATGQEVQAPLEAGKTAVTELSVSPISPQTSTTVAM